MSMHQFNGGGLSAAILKNIAQTLIDFIKFCTMEIKLTGLRRISGFFFKMCRFFFRKKRDYKSSALDEKNFSHTPRWKSEPETVTFVPHKLHGIISLVHSWTAFA